MDITFFGGPHQHLCKQCQPSFKHLRANLFMKWHKQWFYNYILLKYSDFTYVQNLSKLKPQRKELPTILQKHNSNCLNSQSELANQEEGFESWNVFHSYSYTKLVTIFIIGWQITSTPLNSITEKHTSWTLPKSVFTFYKCMM